MPRVQATTKSQQAEKVLAMTRVQARTKLQASGHELLSLLPWLRRWQAAALLTNGAELYRRAKRVNLCEEIHGGKGQLRGNMNGGHTRWP